MQDESGMGFALRELSPVGRILHILTRSDGFPLKHVKNEYEHIMYKLLE